MDTCLESALSIGSIKKGPVSGSSLVIKEPLRDHCFAQQASNSIDYLSRSSTLKFWSGAMVVLPVFLQAPWAHLQPLTACLFTFVILGFGVLLAQKGGPKWFNAGALLIGVSGSWLGGCLFWGWLRSHPVFHIPVEAIAMPIALVGLNTRWRVASAFYLAALLGTAFTDVSMVMTGVMNKWPSVINATFQEAPEILNQTAQELMTPISISSLLLVALLILFLSRLMSEKANTSSIAKSAWLVASAALTTTLWVDGLFLLTAVFHPRLSGLI